MDPLSEEWVAALVAASAAADDDKLGSRSGPVEVKIGKKERVVLTLDRGRFVGPGSDGDDVELTLPFADVDELDSYLSGQESMAKAYIRGDFKPTGSTGVLLTVIELVESGALADLG